MPRPGGRRPARRHPGPRPPDAIEVRTDGLTPDQVVDRLEALVRGEIAPPVVL